MNLLIVADAVKFRPIIISSGWCDDAMKNDCTSEWHNDVAIIAAVGDKKIKKEIGIRTNTFKTPLPINNFLSSFAVFKFDIAHIQNCERPYGQLPATCLLILLIHNHFIYLL